MLPKYMIRLNKIRITYLAVLSKILATSVKVRSRSSGQDLLGRLARAIKGGCFLTWPMPEFLSIKCAIFCFGELPREKLSSLYISFKSFQSWWWVCGQWMASAVAMGSSLSPLPLFHPMRTSDGSCLHLLAKLRAELWIRVWKEASQDSRNFENSSEASQSWCHLPQWWLDHCTSALLQIQMPSAFGATSQQRSTCWTLEAL